MGFSFIFVFMKKFIFSVTATICLAAASFGQKVDYKDNIISVDGQFYAYMERQGCGFGDPECNFIIKDKENKTQLVLKIDGEDDLSQASSAHPKGIRVTWADVYFLQSKQKAQTQRFYVRSGKMASEFVKWELFKDGMLDSTRIEEYVLLNPEKFPKNKTKIIVETREAPPAKKPGVQISF